MPPNRINWQIVPAWTNTGSTITSSTTNWFNYGISYGSNTIRWEAPEPTPPVRILPHLMKILKKWDKCSALNLRDFVVQLFNGNLGEFNESQVFSDLLHTTKYAAIPGVMHTCLITEMYLRRSALGTSGLLSYIREVQRKLEKEYDLAQKYNAESQMADIRRDYLSMDRMKSDLRYW